MRREECITFLNGLNPAKKNKIKFVGALVFVIALFFAAAELIFIDSEIKRNSAFGGILGGVLMSTAGTAVMAWAKAKSDAVFFSVFAGGIIVRMLTVVAAALVVYRLMPEDAHIVLVPLVISYAVLSVMESKFFLASPVKANGTTGKR